jgi:hypothetical protein
VVANLHLGALGHRPAIGIGQGDLGLTAHLDLLNKSAVALLARFESLDRFLKRLSCLLMNTGCRPISCSQITQVRPHLLIDVLENLLKLCLRKVLVFVVNGLELTAIAGKEFCPKEIQLPAKKDKRSEESLKSLYVIFSEISHGREVGSQFAKKPAELHVAMGFPRQSSARSDPGEVSIARALAQIPWIIGRSPRECGLSPRAPKTRKIETLHIRLNEADRIIFCDIVIEKIRQKKPLGPAVSLHVSHPASLLCIRGRLYCRVGWHKEFSHSLTLG